MTHSNPPPPPPSAAMRARLQLLSCNILAGGSVRRYRDYVTHSWKHVLPTGKRAQPRRPRARDRRLRSGRPAGSRRRQPALGLSQPDPVPRRSGRVSRSGATSRTAACRAWRHPAMACSRAGSPTKCSTIRCPAAFPAAARCGRASASGDDALDRGDRAPLARPGRARAPARVHRRADRPASARGADGRSQHAAREQRELELLYARTALVPPARIAGDVPELAADARDRPHPRVRHRSQSNGAGRSRIRCPTTCRSRPACACRKPSAAPR